MFALALVTASSAGVAGYALTRSGSAPAPEEPRAAAGRDPDTLTTTLVFGGREAAPADEGPMWLAVLWHDRGSDEGGVIYVPAHTAAEIPGRGLHALAEAVPAGGIPLLLVAVENLLGVRIDRYLELSDRDARVLFAATGPLTVDVPSDVRVRVGPAQARLLFAEGTQQLDPDFLVQLLYRMGIGSDDVELGNRHLAFWDALFRSFAADPPALRAALEEANAALVESDAAPPDHARFLQDLATLDPAARVLVSLPVSQVSVGRNELYESPPDELESFLAELLGGSRGPGDDIRVQVLNGNGVPGIGQEVASRLVGEGFRVILSGNAPRLDYPRTLIVTYDPSPVGRALAARARRLLGIGEVQISAQQQGIVDLTIVVGEDFVPES